jgi:hypothetical protein
VTGNTIYTCYCPQGYGGPICANPIISQLTSASSTNNLVYGGAAGLGIGILATAAVMKLVSSSSKKKDEEKQESEKDEEKQDKDEEKDPHANPDLDEQKHEDEDEEKGDTVVFPHRPMEPVVPHPHPSRPTATTSAIQLTPISRPPHAAVSRPSLPHPLPLSSGADTGVAISAAARPATSQATRRSVAAQRSPISAPVLVTAIRNTPALRTTITAPARLLPAGDEHEQ